MNTEKIEFHAGTVDEALDKASARLGIPREQLSYEVLDPGSAGFLGLGTRDARILVENDARTPDSRAIVEEVFAESGGETAEEEARPSGEASPEILKTTREQLTRIVENMGLTSCEVEVYDAGEIIAADVRCEESGLFIGHKGETIDAVQYLLNVAVYRRHEYEKKIVVDCEGYRQRRIEAVQSIAHRTARRSIKERRPLKLPPMNAAERRAVHLYLKDNPKVTTVSEGRDENRRVVVKPL
jgi:spoIIIJ-associated protein